MLLNYLKIAFRNILKQKTFSAINILGLALGMTVCLLMIMYVLKEYSFDDFHEKKDRIFRVNVEWGSGESMMKFAGAMPAIAPALNESVPEVEFAARLMLDYNSTIINSSNGEIKEDNFFFADPEIFKILDFQFIAGNQEQILIEPFTIVLSKNTALKYFGTLDAIGNTINYGEYQLKVTGIFNDLPVNSHLNCKFIASYSTLQAIGREVEMPWNQWGDELTYILLKKNASINGVAEQLNSLFKANAGEWLSSRCKFVYEKISDIHWDTDLVGDIGTKGNITYIQLFLSASIFILLIACFNFINLTMSRHFERMKETGVRKVIGASRRQLIIQHLVESLLTSAISIAISILLFKLFYNLLFEFLGTYIEFNPANFNSLFILIVVLVLIAGVLSGGYPAFYISKFKAANVLKRNNYARTERITLRKVLVIFQFAVTIILVAGALIIYQQIDYMKTTDVGFDKSGVIILNYSNNEASAKEKYSVLRDEFMKFADVISVSGAYTTPGIQSQFNKSIGIKGKSKDDIKTFQFLPADYGFIKSLGLKLIQGRNFSKDISTDETSSIILNETGVKELGLENPIGTIVNVPGGEAEIIGVIKDFHIKSLHHKIAPLFIQIEPKSFNHIMVKVKPDNRTQTLSLVKETWEKILPGTEVTYRYLEDAYNDYYHSEVKTSKLLYIFTALAIVLSCLGLLGLVYFKTNSRVKEIGIRKAIGASTTNITILLSRQFLLWIGLSNIVAWPVAYYLTMLWLENFAYRVTLSVLPFFLSGSLVMLISILTVSYKSIKAASANPVQSLKYE